MLQIFIFLQLVFFFGYLSAPGDLPSVNAAEGIPFRSRSVFRVPISFDLDQVESQVCDQSWQMTEQDMAAWSQEIEEPGQGDIEDFIFLKDGVFLKNLARWNELCKLGEDDKLRVSIIVDDFNMYVDLIKTMMSDLSAYVCNIQVVRRQVAGYIKYQSSLLRDIHLLFWKNSNLRKGFSEQACLVALMRAKQDQDLCDKYNNCEESFDDLATNLPCKEWEEALSSRMLLFEVALRRESRAAEDFLLNQRLLKKVCFSEAVSYSYPRLEHLLVSRGDHLSQLISSTGAVCCDSSSDDDSDSGDDAFFRTDSRSDYVGVGDSRDIDDNERINVLLCSGSSSLRDRRPLGQVWPPVSHGSE